MRAAGRKGGLMTWLDERQNVPAGTVMDLATEAPRTIRRDWDHLVIPELRLDAAGRATLRKILDDVEPVLAMVRAEMDADEAEWLAHAEWREG